MPIPRTTRSVRLAVEALEPREVPSAAALLLEGFDQIGRDLPADWAQWSNQPAGAFAVAPNQGLASRAGLVSGGASGTEARAWAGAALPADVRASVAIYLDSLVPATLFVRGQKLDTAAPSFYGVSVTRGAEVNLIRVIDGQATVLGTVRSSEWLSGQWVRVSLTAEGDTLRARVFRTDTGQYLNAKGAWQGAPADALVVTDAALPGPGHAGVARPARVAGSAAFDGFEVTAPSAAEPPPTTVHEQNFDRAGAGLPAGWKQWANPASLGFHTDRELSLGGSGALRSEGSSLGVARAWLGAPQPPDVRLSAAVYLDSLIPAHLIVRGSNLGGSEPTYYGVSITRGLELELIRVVGGRTTVLSRMGSEGWQSQQWVQVVLEAHGDRLRVKVYRPDRAQYLAPNGQWQSSEVWAMEATDTVIRSGGLVGVGRAENYAGRLIFDNVVVSTPARPAAPAEPLPVKEPAPLSPPPPPPPAAPPAEAYSFDGEVRGALPPGWVQWTNAAKVKGGFQVSGPGFGNTSNTLVSAGSPEVEARLWLESPYGPHTEVATSVYVDGTAAAQFFLRGQDLQTPAPSYYAVSVGRGGAVSLLRSAEGRVTELASARPIETLGDQWLRVRFQARGQTLRVLLARSDTGQYLTPSGAWTSAETAALTVTVPDAARGGYVGLVRPSLTGGRAFFDDLAITALPAPAPAPAVPPPPPVVPPPVSAPAPALPSAPRHYSHIRLAQLAYAGTPLSAFEQRLLRESIDVVIPNPSYLQDIARAAPGTPRIIYSNVSNIYLGLLTDWLAYADAHGHSRESAFYHVTEATPFTGGSASSVPVNWFWSVQRGAPGNWTDLTAAARNANERFQLAAPGESVVIGYTERFRELNLRVTFPGSASWGAVLEYVSAVNPDGSPAAWSALPILSDGTLGLRRSGAVVFDPPADWVAASLNGGDRLYHVRIRSIGSGAAPVVGSILGRDYVQARGGISGVIPAFDYAADRDGDGYLNDAEYARRRPGMDARFEYESRAFYPAYGQMRFATNPSSPGFRAWAVDYTVRLLDAHPLAGGVFLDNSPGRLQIPRESVRESTGRYAEDFGTLLGAINRATGPKWVLANTAGGREDAEPTIRSGVSFLEEFGLRPLAHNHVQFEDMAALVEQRLRELAGRGYAILDTLPQNGSPTDPRTQIAALAYYYLLADPDATMLMFFGGAEPNTSWTRHWVPAAAYDVGRPAGGWGVFATGEDPADRRLDYKVYQRRYENALVLYKPLSYRRNQTGTTADLTATTHQLDGVYRPLQANGNLGPPTNRVTLRNGEGAILVRVG